MKKLIYLIILLYSLSSQAQKKDCLDFRTGEFEYVNFDRPEKIIRKDSLQIETNPFDNIIIKSSIKWISDCEYIMTYKEILNHPKDVSSDIGKKIYCEIIEINGSRLKVRAKSDVLDEVIEFKKIDEFPSRYKYTVSVDLSTDTFIKPYVDSLNLAKARRIVPTFLNQTCFDYQHQLFSGNIHNPISLRKKIISNIKNQDAIKYLLRNKRLISNDECSELLEGIYGGQPDKMDSQEVTTLSMLKAKLKAMKNQK